MAPSTTTQLKNGERSSPCPHRLHGSEGMKELETSTWHLDNVMPENFESVSTESCSLGLRGSSPLPTGSSIASRQEGPYWCLALDFRSSSYSQEPQVLHWSKDNDIEILCCFGCARWIPGTNRRVNSLTQPGMEEKLYRQSPGHVQVTQLGHVKDLATAFVKVLGNPAATKQTYNISGERYVTFDGLAKACALAAGAPEPELIHFDPKAVDLGKAKAFPLRDQHFFTSIEKVSKLQLPASHPCQEVT